MPNNALLTTAAIRCMRARRSAKEFILELITMVFADLKYSGRYEDIHHDLVSFIKTRFDRVEGGLQGDSYSWIWIRDDKVAIDSFSSMTHQVKASRPGNHVEKVIEVLREKYALNVYADPEMEPHEDG